MHVSSIKIDQTRGIFDRIFPVDPRFSTASGRHAAFGLWPAKAMCRLEQRKCGRCWQIFGIYTYTYIYSYIYIYI